MEGNTNWKPNRQGGDSLANNANDWRSQHDPSLRNRVIAKVVEKLKEYYPKRCPDDRQNEFYNSAAKFEERIYTSAKNKDDYLLKLSEKMHMMEKTYQNNKHLGSSVNASNTPNPAQVVNQAQSLQTSLPYMQNSRSQQRLPQNTQSNLNITASSGLPNQVPINVSVAHAQNVSIHIGEGVQINLIPGTQRHMQGRQQLLPQQQQLLKENIGHGNLRPPHIQQQSQPPQQQQQQHPQSLLKPPIQQSSSGQQNSQFQPRNQFLTQLVRSNHQQHMAMPSKEPEKQEQDRLFSQLMNQDAQQSYQAMTQQSNNIQNTHQQRHNSSALPSQQQQNMPGSSKSGNFNVPRSSFMVTQGQEMGQTHQQTMLQQYQSQHHPAQQPQNRSLPQHLDPGKNVTQRFQTDQQIQQYQFERTPLANPSTSQDSTGQTENVNGGNWQEETYQKIKALKEKYLHILSALYQRLRDKMRQNESLPQSGQLEKLKLGKSMLARMIMFLSVERNTISEKHRDSFEQLKGQILKYTKQPMQSQNHQMNLQLMPSNQNVASSLVSMPHLLLTRPKIEPRDDDNIMASSGNVVLPSLIQNPASNPQVQSSVLEKPKPKPTIFHHRQMQQQPLHRKQQQQQERQENPQLQIPTLQQKHEMNDVRMKQGINNKAELLQQHLSSSPRQLLKPIASSGWMSNLSPSPSSPRIVDEQILPATVNKTGTALQSGGSPFVSQSPVTSFAPSPVPGDLEKPISVESPVAPPFSLPVKPIAERPIDRLIKAYQSSSQQNLAESVSEIRAVVNMVDRIAGSFHPSGLGEDLSARTQFPFMAHGETNPSKRMKRTISALPQDIGSMASSSNNIVPRFALLQEIKEINERLIETVVEICDEVTSGTIVVCSYSPVALSATYKAHYMSGKISQIQPLRVVIPANYPNSSPILLDEISLDASVHIYEDLSARTRSRFSLSMKELSDPASLKEIAQMWNDCARATMAEYAERHGGGTFSSKYGPWETVLGSSCTLNTSGRSLLAQVRSGDFAKR
ncbi:putative mediator of RNA polymerase II transcription subunit 15c [Cardamine amara subsp. amara]|uniref:Mediator of RNA polymerase II transcription subunit 15c n=1 Tax=Cardamine amara subsp. amara TaxID=228776 RepID=A0ABD0ZIJ4_CARAN